MNILTFLEMCFAPWNSLVLLPTRYEHALGYLGKKTINTLFSDVLPCFSQVRYLKIIEKSGYQALPWVRYITQNGGKLVLIQHCKRRYLEIVLSLIAEHSFRILENWEAFRLGANQRRQSHLIIHANNAMIQLKPSALPKVGKQSNLVPNAGK